MHFNTDYSLILQSRYTAITEVSSLLKYTWLKLSAFSQPLWNESATVKLRNLCERVCGHLFLHPALRRSHWHCCNDWAHQMPIHHRWHRTLLFLRSSLRERKIQRWLHDSQDKVGLSGGKGKKFKNNQGMTWDERESHGEYVRNRAWITASTCTAPHTS